MKKTRRTNKSSNIFLKILLVLIIIAAVIIIGAHIYIESLNSAYIPGSEDIYDIEIPAGSSSASIGSILQDAGIIKNAGSFRIYSRIKHYDGKLKAGEYPFSPSMTLDEILDIISSGKTNSERFTVPEGLTLSQTADILEEKQLINREAFMKALSDYDFDYRFLKGLSKGTTRLEGFLFPETYDVFTTADEKDIIDIMLRQFDTVFKDAYYDRAEELGYSIKEVITIASLIERETRIDEERPVIASVIYNRLRAGQRLQIDATVQYALGDQKEYLSYEDLKTESPYNTYIVDGLPAGPICSPGEASIKAALYPEDTDYMYYVLKSKDDISHNFAETYNEFLEYKAKYKSSFNN